MRRSDDASLPRGSLESPSQRAARQGSLCLGHELVCDLFAGGGGASLGIESALGRPVDVACNHSAAAIAMHRVNHPDTRHFQCDIYEVSPTLATGGAPTGLIHASPDCRHYSRASGASKRDPKIRGLIWVILRWAYETRARVLTAENVEEVQSAGPLDSNGKPIKAMKGLFYDGFIRMLTTGVAPDHPALAEAMGHLDGTVPAQALITGLGYHAETRILNAAHFGAGTERKRWFLVARRDNRPIQWPRPTHGTGQRPLVSAASSIDWSQPMASIFLDRDQAKQWGHAHNKGTPKRPLAAKTMARIAAGVRRYLLDEPNPFMVDGDAAFIAQHNTGVIGRHAIRPLSTITSRGSQQAVVRVKIAPFTVPRYGERPGQAPRSRSIKRPMATITATGNEGSLVSVALSARSAGIQPVWREQIRDLLAPVRPNVPRAELEIITLNGRCYEITDIQMRMFTPRELYVASGFPRDYEINPNLGSQPLTNTEQYRCVGNAVPPPLIEALIRCNFQHENRLQERTEVRAAG